MTFKEPPTLKLSKITMAASMKDATGKPTAENLRRLGTASDRGGARSARSGRSRMSQTSRGEPVDPFKDHTVEQMDELISKITLDIHRLMVKKKHEENNPLATKTSIKGKVKPLVEEMNVLRAQLFEYQYIRDAKIPDHEKLPKTCIYYKHYL